MVMPDELGALEARARDAARARCRAGRDEVRAAAPEARVQMARDLLSEASRGLPVYEQEFLEVVRMVAVVLHVDIEHRSEAYETLRQVLGHLRARVGRLNVGYGQLLRQYGRLLFLEGRHAEARVFLLEAFDVLLVTSGPHTDATVLAAEYLGSVQHALEENEAAAGTFEMLLEWLKDLPVPDPNRQRIGGLVLRLATVQYDLQNFVRAAELAENARAELLRLGDSARFDLADLISLLGRIAEREGREDVAEARYLESLGIFSDAERLGRTGAAWTNLLLGRLYLRSGREDEALVPLSEARQAYIAAGATEGPLFATVEDALARYNVHARNLSAAREHSESAWRMISSYYGENARQMVPFNNNYGMVLYEQGELLMARPLLERALELLDSGSVAARALLQSNLALVSEALGMLDRASVLLREALREIDPSLQPVVAGNLLRVLRLIATPAARAAAEVWEGRASEIPPTPLYMDVRRAA